MTCFHRPSPMVVAILGCAAVAVWLPGCASRSVTLSDRSQLEGQLLEADRAFSDASKEEGMSAAFTDFLALDSVALPNQGHALVGRATIAEFIAADPTMAVEWKPEIARLSEDGTLGYTWGHLIALFPDVGGGPHASTGKYMTVWSRESSGRWRVISFMNNQSPSKE